MSSLEKAAQRSPLVEWGVAGRAMAGHAESGDRAIVVPYPGGILLGALDGLGHGDEAAAAAKAALEILEREPEAPVIWLARSCHEGLLETRGVVMSLASISAGYGTMTWLGVGNVEGTLLRADRTAKPPQESLLLRGGVVGYQLPQLYATGIPIARGDVLVFATDGVRSEFLSQIGLGEPPQQLADRLLAQFAKSTDDALVLVAEFLGGTS